MNKMNEKEKLGTLGDKHFENCDALLELFLELISSIANANSLYRLLGSF